MCFRKCALRLFYGQRDTPVVPQMPVEPTNFKATVAYFLARNPVVKHDPHPLELELANVVDRDHARYARHEDESITHFFQRQGISIDTANRTDPKVIQSDIYGVESYTDALKTTLSRFKPSPRVVPNDFFDPFDPDVATAPPQRQTLNRRLSDFLYLIVKDAKSGKWRVPGVERTPSESLRMTVDRALYTHHPGITTYTVSNCPQGVVQLPDLHDPIYIFSTTYLSGRPHFDPAVVASHAWVTRSELSEYEFESDEMFRVLRDISVSGYFDGRGLH